MEPSTLFQIVILAFYCGTSTIASVANVVRPLQVYLTDRPTLFTTSWHRCGASHDLSMTAETLFVMASKSDILFRYGWFDVEYDAKYRYQYRDIWLVSSSYKCETSTQHYLSDRSNPLSSINPCLRMFLHPSLRLCLSVCVVNFPVANLCVLSVFLCRTNEHCGPSIRGHGTFFVSNSQNITPDIMGNVI